jgi:hypothetical protein
MVPFCSLSLVQIKTKTKSINMSLVMSIHLTLYEDILDFIIFELLVSHKFMTKASTIK